jgi:hypothetical protein
MLKQAAVFDYFQSEVRQRVKFDILAAGLVSDQARFVVDLDLVAVANLLKNVGKLDYVKAAVDRIAVENTGKRLRDDTADLCAADRPDGVLAARTAAKIVTGNDDIAGLYFLDKIRVEVFHAVRRKLGLVIGIQIPRRNDLVRIYMISFIYMCLRHFYSILSNHGLIISCHQVLIYYLAAFVLLQNQCIV